MAKRNPVSKAGWTLDEHLRATGFSRSFHYSLPPERRPHGVYVTPRKYVITESPEAYLSRLSEQAPVRKKAPAEARSAAQ